MHPHMRDWKERKENVVVIVAISFDSRAVTHYFSHRFWFSFCFSFFALHCLPLECIEEFIFRIWDCSGCCTKTSSVNKWILDSVLVRNGYLNEAAGAVVVSCWIYICIGNTGLWILKFLWISGEKKSFSISQSKTVSEWTFPLSEVEHIEKG